MHNQLDFVLCSPSETFVEALVDGSAKMPCNVLQRKDDGIEFIFWYKNDGVTALYTLDARDRRLANATHMRNETYSDRVQFHVTGDVPYLQMDYLREEDTGSYFCRVDYQWSATELKRVNLVVVAIVFTINWYTSDGLYQHRIQSPVSSISPYQHVIADTFFLLPAIFIEISTHDLPNNYKQTTTQIKQTNK
ncbi:transposable element Tcb1 transposase [Caerostris extrusa]|uniref:Transposable element Tcb1 transposase n=1 Tax=Caerostris extrusa TaxID=172846 RepID=A0AAV4T615_CAEEX|nr:transposable element Tcb1 transposase [Caerostris extrusa]